MSREDIEQHYYGQWGESELTKEFTSPDVNLVMHRWAQSARTGGVAIYATCGVSDRRDGEGNGVEVLAGIAPACDEILEPMANVAASIVEAGNVATHGGTWDMGGPLWSGTELGFFLTLHQHPALPPLVNSAGKVEFYTAIPIFEYEAKLAKSAGLSALKASWKSAKVSFWNPNRGPST